MRMGHEEGNHMRMGNCISTDSPKVGRRDWNKVKIQKYQWEKDCNPERSAHLVNLGIGFGNMFLGGVG